MLGEFFCVNVKATNQEVLEFISLGKELGAINNNVEEKTLSVLLDIVVEGISSNILYYSDEGEQIDLIKAWQQFVNLIIL
ncbi:MAG: hypothetical protein ATN36_04670 [Epulopiscium sp. Nele67-Bin005]|nr:MAG: hypothetical protein ATN36_04670 [Epulopiscium sp. Nele67-Bin005]